jgi:hypothetical protein
MPKGPKGEKRPADVIGNAVKVMRIATGAEEEDIDQPGEEPGRLGGYRRPRMLSVAIVFGGEPTTGGLR